MRSHEANCFCINDAFRDLTKNRGAYALRRKFCKMNCREQIYEHLLIERMKFWLSRSRYSDTYPRWRARKNFWSLVRKHGALAARHGFREKDVF